MSAAPSLTAFAKPERLSVRAQTKLAPSEAKMLDEFVDQCEDEGWT